MKANWMLLILLFILSACGDLTYRYYTRINADGTVFKRITAEGDSSSVYGQPFSFDINEGWNLKYDKKIDKENGDTLFLAIAEKTFESIEAVNFALHLKNDSASKDNVHAELTSRFAWFFTFHEYTETYLQRFPFHHYSIDDYLSNEEYAYFFLDDTSCVETMSKEETKVFDQKGELKFWKYMSASLGAEYIRLLDEYASVNGQDRLDRADSLFIMQVFESSIDDGPELEEICLLMDQRLGVEWVSEAFCNEYFARFEKQIEDEVLFMNETDYFADVEVPGWIYSTNATSINNRIAKWHFKRGSFAYKDFVLSLRYRTINYWAFIVVGVLVIILVSSFLLKRRS
ncbi:hypothetical protein J1N10_03800 [Carboxylicivirga sp. A043]|uniref:hypothetical protein n=1 Tax=Carboxylicivirga litoralis TaxID=2816963 RepID=UPI0021CB6BE0|nr:hypothetical protein [Carboxylicivirga sp. A043]MCU4155084.1 hypothetical protein [Carboxylicivirga sp. A043]